MKGSFEVTTEVTTDVIAMKDLWKGSLVGFATMILVLEMHCDRSIRGLQECIRSFFRVVNLDPPTIKRRSWDPVSNEYVVAPCPRSDTGSILHRFGGSKSDAGRADGFA